MNDRTLAEPADAPLPVHDEAPPPAHATRAIPLLSALNRYLTQAIGTVGGIARAADLLVVFASIFWRYALNEPVE